MIQFFNCRSCLKSIYKVWPIVIFMHRIRDFYRPLPSSKSVKSYYHENAQHCKDFPQSAQLYLKALNEILWKTQHDYYLNICYHKFSLKIYNFFTGITFHCEPKPQLRYQHKIKRQKVVEIDLMEEFCSAQNYNSSTF